MTQAGTTWLATGVGLSLLLALALALATGKTLRLLNKAKPANDDDEERYPRPKLKKVLYLVNLALLLFVLRAAIVLGYIVTLLNDPWTFGSCLLTSQARCNAAIQKQNEWSLQVGRLSYAHAFFTIVTKVMLFVVLIAMKRLLLLPKGMTPTRGSLSRWGDALQVLVLFVLGIAAWGTALSRKRYGSEYTVEVSSVSTDIQDVGFFPADIQFSKGVYIWAAFACWLALMAVPIVATLFRKISHARKAGLPEAEIHITSVFAKWIVPILLFIAGLFMAYVFLLIFRKDLDSSATAAPAALEAVSVIVGDVAVYWVSIWALSKLVKQLPKNDATQPAVAVAQV